LRIGVIHNLKRGGAWRRLVAQIEHLDEDVIEVCPRTAEPVTDRPFTVPLRLRATAAPRLRRPLLRYADQRQVERAWREVATLVGTLDVDVVYVNPCSILQTPPALCHGLPPTVYFCDEPRRVDHDPGARTSRSQLTTPMYMPIYRRQRSLDTESAQRATTIATNSRFSAQAIADAYGREAVVVPMGVPDSFLRKAGPVWAPRDILLSVGTLIPSKGHDLVIEAVSQSGLDRSLIVVAPRPEPSESVRLTHLADRLGVRLEIQTEISDAQLRALYSRAEATLYLAAGEPLGLVSLEAQACGSPVIVSQEGGLPETVIDGVTGWTAPRRPEDAAQCLRRLRDPALSHTMSQSARAHGQGMTWERSAAVIRDLLTQVHGLVIGRNTP
jgi:glycosyltransferase involved in cell wall biosynthesis